jgi:predicted nuclease of restriction endonuclease-like (RecB) superfamily
VRFESFPVSFNTVVANVAKTLIELGTGFAFLGNQYHLNVDNEDYYLVHIYQIARRQYYIKTWI